MCDGSLGLMLVDAWQKAKADLLNAKHLAAVGSILCQEALCRNAS